MERLGHMFFRFCLPVKVHPTLYDVIPSPPNIFDYPYVAIQLPMMNEIECCQSAIECACNLDWPKTRLYIQVLDDSTDRRTMTLIDECVVHWRQQDIQIEVIRRPHRIGFKAGNLNHGMSFIREASYIAIFDVDFLPTSDYLIRIIPTLMQDSTISFVQARWTFTNAKESFLTRMQEIWLNYHHKCEQEGNYRAGLFFGFNGTGGVWRRTTIEQCGGWNTDTLVEDMDLSLRAYLNGWRSVYMKDVECLNEIPPTFSAYLSQQHRWTSGPMQIMRTMTKHILETKFISLPKKLWCLWFLFMNFIHLFNLIALVIMLPISILIPTTSGIYSFGLWIMVILTLPVVGLTPDELHLTVFFILFSNAMALHKGCAVIAGLFNYKSTKKWIVTPKYNCARNVSNEQLIEIQSHDSTESIITSSIEDTKSSILSRFSFNSSIYKYICQMLKSFRFYKWNFMMSLYLFILGFFAFYKTQYVFSIYIFFNGVIYGIFAFGCMGRITVD